MRLNADILQVVLKLQSFVQWPFEVRALHNEGTYSQILKHQAISAPLQSCDQNWALDSLPALTEGMLQLPPFTPFPTIYVLLAL